MLIETKKSIIKMLKMVLFDRAINEKCCSVDGGRGICRLFLYPPPGICHTVPKNANAQGSARGGGLGCQAQVELTLEGRIAFRILLTSTSNTAFMENRLSFYKLILFIYLLISTFIFVNTITINSIVCKHFQDIVYCIFSLIVFTVSK